MDQGGYYASFHPGIQPYSGPTARGVLSDAAVFSGPQNTNATSSKLDEILTVLKSQQLEIASLKSEVTYNLC